VRYLAIAFFALIALRCEARDSIMSALEVTGKRGVSDAYGWQQVDRIVRRAARQHRLSPGPANSSRPAYLLTEKSYYTYYETRYRTTIDVTYRRQVHRPIEIEILEIGARHPSDAHLALLSDLQSGLSKSGLLVKRGETRRGVTTE
jgi:hypothetical protein